MPSRIFPAGKRTKACVAWAIHKTVRKTMRNVLTIALLLVSGLVFSQKKQSATAKKELDRAAILKLEGCYKVTFSFAETFSPNPDYEYHNDRKYESAIEMVKLIENTPNKISFQHLLVVDDETIVKHWRQDWVYENTDFLFYDRKEDKKEIWNRVSVSPEKVKGTWTQQVFQVDDSPRYQGYGTWVHVDGRSFWEAKADAPLPRREHTKRSDYNVTGRFSHIEILEDGWVLEQDNDKILREKNRADVLIAQEKGIERFWQGDHNCKAAEDYWAKSQAFWKTVREVWAKKLAKGGSVSLEVSKNGKIIYMRMFELCEEATKDGTFNVRSVREAIQQIVDEHVTVEK